MSSYYYRKAKRRDIRKILRVVSILISLIGIFALFYVFFPLLSWQMYFAPTFASQQVAIPIPQSTRVTNSTLEDLVSQASSALKGIDYTNAQNWFPTHKAKNQTIAIPSYLLSIPKLGIKNATVSTVDYDLSAHLVHYNGTALPPYNGNAVIFGHSTLPQLFNPNDYKTIFATLFTLEVGDEILVSISQISYRYKVTRITIVDPSDTSPLMQQYDDAYLTLVTCTPPGTTWKRLIVKTRLEKI